MGRAWNGIWNFFVCCFSDCRVEACDFFYQYCRLRILLQELWEVEVDAGGLEDLRFFSLPDVLSKNLPTPFSKAHAVSTHALNELGMLQYHSSKISGHLRVLQLDFRMVGL